MLARISRGMAALIGAAALLGTTSPERPPQLDPYFDGDTYEAGQFEWLRGGFDGATETELATFDTVNAWVNACFEDGREATIAELSQRGITVADPEQIHVAPLECILVSSRPDIDEFETYEAFSEALAETRPIFDALRAAADRGRGWLDSGNTDLVQQLEAATMQDQMLRNAYYWVRNDRPDTPRLTDRQKPIFSALLSAETMRVDHENTQWLKSVVAERGWPTISEVGARAAQRAWLLAQHADLDPVFQLDALRLMEPLVEEGEVSPRSYAYLYDRVMLKLAGKQRYATQMGCQEGKMAPRPLEDPDAVADQRAKMELEPLEDYLQNFPATCG